MVLQRDCKWCKKLGKKAKHKASTCPNKPKAEKEESGRGLSGGGSKYAGVLDAMIAHVDRARIFDQVESGVSLVGGYKGKKPKAIQWVWKKDKTIRIDLQATGNLQFQVGGGSFAKVTYTNASTAQEVLNGLVKSLTSGSEVPLD